MAIYHQNNFATNLTSNILAGATTAPLNSIPSVAVDFYLALDATNINNKYEVVLCTSKNATNVNFAACTYAHTTAEEVRMVVPAEEMDNLFLEHNQDGTHKTTGDGILAIMSALNPVGTIREFNVSTDPATLLGFGTWSAFGTGRVTVAIDAGQTEFDVNGETGGAKTHTLSIAELPSHNHNGATGGQTANHTHDTLIPRTNDNNTSASSIGFLYHGDDGTTATVTSKTSGGASSDHVHGITAQGSDSAHNNLQPYIVVYRWVRTA